MKGDNLAPVALFTYNRPDHTRRTVEALARNIGADRIRLWVFSDAPRDARAGPAVEAVRSYVRTLSQAGLFGEVVVREAPANQGLKRAIIDGVSQVMAAHDRAIVLEDDLLTAPDFLVFMNDCLDFYAEDPTVGSVAGYCPLDRPPAGYAHSVYAIPRSFSHGWATWSDRWATVDWDARRYGEFRRSASMRRAFDAYGSDRSRRLAREMDRGAQSWSILFGFSQFLAGQNTIIPVVTRIANIGRDGSGVHQFDSAVFNDALPEEATPYILAHVQPDRRVMRAFRKVYSGSPLRRLVQAVRNLGP